jgi:hypothetical protein
MKKLFFIIMVSLFANSFAQKSMRIHYHHETHTDTGKKSDGEQPKNKSFFSNKSLFCLARPL